MTGSANFRLTRMNKDYTLCSTYPSVFVVPASITDDMLTRVASFREKGRVCAQEFLVFSNIHSFFRFLQFHGCTQTELQLPDALSHVWVLVVHVVWMMRRCSSMPFYF